jgi:hypothetical protein
MAVKPGETHTAVFGLSDLVCVVNWKSIPGAWRIEWPLFVSTECIISFAAIACAVQPIKASTVKRIFCHARFLVLHHVLTATSHDVS